jgi:hypothetical protein
MAAGTKSSYDPEEVLILALGFHYSGYMLVQAHGAHLGRRAGALGLTQRRVQLPGMAEPVVQYFGDAPTVSGLPCLVPGIVLLCFAAELYLKSILLLNGVHNPRGHDLLDLYDQLTPPQQSRLEAIFQRLYGGTPGLVSLQYTMQVATPGLTINMREAITQSRNAFDRWRFAFEANPGSSLNSFINDPFQVLIVEDRPDWTKHVHAIKALPPAILVGESVE